MMTVAQELGYHPIFLAAKRTDDLADTDVWEGIPVERLGRPFPLVNGKQPVTYLRGVLGYWFAVLRRLRALRPKIVHASDFECGVPALIYRAFWGGRFIYNIHDNLSQRYAMPSALRPILNALEGAIAWFADVALVPEAFRREALPGWARQRVEVVRNTPQDPGYSPRIHHDGERIKLFFGGWLDSGRGIQGLLRLIEANDQLELLVAGEGSPETVATLAAASRVKYMGYLTQRETIAATRDCDLVVAFYDPQRLINIFAASNKIAEALALGRPLLINAETRIASYLSTHGCAVVIPYEKISAAGPAVQQFVSDRKGYQTASASARACYESDYSYASIHPVMLRALGAREPKASKAR